MNLYQYCGNNAVNWIDPWGVVRKPGKTPPSRWPDLPPNLGGKKPKWNPEGYWEGDWRGRYNWDDRSHGSGVDRGEGEQGGHWDDEVSGDRWDEEGNPLPGNKCPKEGKSRSFDNWKYWEDLTGLTGLTLFIYLLISEGSRIVIPPRNFVPVP